jgi:O-antigen/teichoic acid export membrane protein
VTQAAASTGSSVLRGGFWFTASRLIPQLYSLAISIAAARFLGPSGMGRQSFIAFAEISLAVLLANGMFLALMRSVGEAVGRNRPDALRELLAWGLRIEGAAAALGAGVLLLSAELGARPRAAWQLAAVACGIAILHTVPSAVLIGMQRWRQAAMVGLVTGAVGTPATVAVLAAGGGITGMFAVEAAVSACNLVWTGLLARPLLATSGKAPGDDAFAALVRTQTLRFALFTTASEALTYVVDRRSELFFLKAYSTSTQIALYSIAFAMVTALVQVPIAMATVLTPAIATLFGAGAVERIRWGYARAVRLLLLASLPLTAAGLSIGPALLRSVYGSAYRSSGPVLLIVLAAFPLVPLAAVASALLTGIGRGRVLLFSSAVAAAVDVGLAAAFVPGHGAVGAAIANLGGQLAVAALLLSFARRLTGPIRLERRSLAAGAIASAGAALAGWLSITLLAGPVGVVLGAIAAAAAFATLAAGLRILPPDDAAWLDEAIGGHFKGGVGRFCRLCARPAPMRP